MPRRICQRGFDQRQVLGLFGSITGGVMKDYLYQRDILANLLRHIPYKAIEAKDFERVDEFRRDVELALSFKKAPDILVLTPRIKEILRSIMDGSDNDIEELDHALRGKI